MVRGRISLGRTGTPRTPDKPDWDAPCRLFEAMADRPPRSHVLGFLLGPDDLVESRVRRDQVASGLHRERVELLDPCDGNAFWGGNACFVPDDVVVDLPRAE